jgi:flagellar biosynthesis/type III secretory pathway M-ring protein FliF/YscJ
VAIAVSNLKPLEEAAILNYVKTGSGINEERGDTITISNIPFRQPPTIIPFPEGGQAVQPSGGPWPWALAFFPAFALLAFLALFLTRHRKAQTEKAQLVSATAPHAVASDIADLISDRTGRSHKTGATRANRTEDFVRLANERPDRVAEALRSTWLNRN